tara:strand:- start:23 stop:229 length:207 start_codon:yes stop_codon:yes gene_type:complete
LEIVKNLVLLEAMDMEAKTSKVGIDRTRRETVTGMDEDFRKMVNRIITIKTDVFSRTDRIRMTVLAPL